MNYYNHRYSPKKEGWNEALFGVLFGNSDVLLYSMILLRLEVITVKTFQIILGIILIGRMQLKLYRNFESSAISLLKKLSMRHNTHVSLTVTTWSKLLSSAATEL
ncbi:MAG: hypothetical protein C5B49_01570 [Bdellovibrio sp.]|nr:MAG: hypothetical protein C5B49_01570 [Bdellovibrio sp.]